MPKKNQRKSRRGKSSAQRAPLTISRPLIANVLRTQMCYTQYFGMVESASGIGASYSFRLNDLFDPDFTGTGQQPVAFDQLSTLYTRFRVLSVAVDVVYNNRAATGAVVGFFPSSASTLPAAAVSWPAQPFSKHTIIANSAAGPAVGRLTSRFDIPTVLGMKSKEYLSDLDFTGTPTSSPIRTPYLHAYIFWQSGTVAVCDAFICMRYVVEWSQPLLNSMS